MSDEAKELYGNRMRDDEWEHDPVDVAVKPSATQVVSFRLPAPELEEIAEAARAAGQTLSEFVREAIAAWLHGTGSDGAAEISGAGGFVLVARPRGFGHTATRATDVQTSLARVPDVPPTTSNIT